MSKISEETIKCPKCGKESKFVMWSSINTVLDPEMKKNQIFIKCGTEYKEMTKELLEACNLAGEIEKKFEKCGLKVLSEYSGDYCIESFHPAALYWYRKNRPQIFRVQLSTIFNIENHSLSPFQYLFGKMILNFISRPDFISYNLLFQGDISLKLAHGLFHAPCAAWVLRSEKELEQCQKQFCMYIFENFLPKQK